MWFSSEQVASSLIRLIKLGNAIRSVRFLRKCCH
jgi:hypothetical protein